ncbi:MAG: RnfABCDGE type electron transport complex subunit D [Lachnospiraceae bacterium]|nr:RnfABCDGE type electron transport complex subunit D [Lachnospiraceae bacterium]
MNNNYIVSAAPHVRSRETTAAILRDVLVALAPAALFGVCTYGFRAFLVLLLSVSSCVLSEYLYKKVRKIPGGDYECSAVVTGLLLGLNLPADIPYWMPVLGGAFAVVVIKMLFGGLGRNLLNPALAAKCLLLLCFGLAGEAIGEGSTLLLLLGGLYLVLCRVISLRLPVAYLLSFAGYIVCVRLFGGSGLEADYLIGQVWNSGLLLGAFFMATDYVTSPMTRWGKVIYGVFLGVLTGVISMLGNTTEGVTFAILIGNLLVPVIEKITLPHFFGKGKKAKV